MKLSDKHLQLFRMVFDRGVGRGCNDLLPEEERLLSKDEWKEFCKAYHEWNGDPESFEERGTSIVPNYVLTDFMVIGYVQHLLIESYKV